MNRNYLHYDPLVLLADGLFDTYEEYFAGASETFMMEASSGNMPNINNIEHITHNNCEDTPPGCYIS